MREEAECISDRFERAEEEKERRRNKMLKCDICLDPIETEKYYEFKNEKYCEMCWEDFSLECERQNLFEGEE